MRTGGGDGSEHIFPPFFWLVRDLVLTTVTRFGRPQGAKLRFRCQALLANNTCNNQAVYIINLIDRCFCKCLAPMP